jgi:EmrB/QacA subfamily drug resistance transporter
MNSYRLFLISILTGTFLVPVNSTMIAIGLTTIAENFHDSLNQATWIITIYLIVMAAAQPVAGKLGDIFGYRRMFLLGLGLSMIGSIACMFSFNLLSMILFRSLQALGGALSVPNATALIRYAVPKEKLTQMLGFFGFLMGMGAAVGPLIGSFLIAAWGWKSVFGVNIPFLMLSFVLAFIVLPKTPFRQSAVDLPGSLFLALSLSLIVLFITHSETIHWWSVLVLLACMLLFVRRETKYPYPLIEFQLFRNRSFALANVFVFLSNALMYGTILIIPILFELSFHLGIKQVGFYLFMFSLSMSLCSWLGGWLSSVIGHKWVILLSFVLQLLSVLLYLGISSQSSLLYIMFSLIVGGLGSGIGLPSMQTTNLESVEREKTGVASGIYSTFRYMGSMMASALISVLVGSSVLFYLMIGIAMVGAGLSACLRPKAVDRNETVRKSAQA